MEVKGSNSQRTWFAEFACNCLVTQLHWQVNCFKLSSPKGPMLWWLSHNSFADYWSNRMRDLSVRVFLFYFIWTFSLLLGPVSTWHRQGHGIWVGSVGLLWLGEERRKRRKIKVGGIENLDNQYKEKLTQLKRLNLEKQKCN